MPRNASRTCVRFLRVYDLLAGPPRPCGRRHVPGRNRASADRAREGSRAAGGHRRWARGTRRYAESPPRRWYPVIDFSRCTNCLECIDFCLFGVYGLDQRDTILVELPDNCRKGCPACSRVCPENAIMFPQHKAPGIAGAAAEPGELKIDLSLLFGGGDGPAAAVARAVRERDEQLLATGHAAVGGSANGAEQPAPPRPAAPSDKLDQLLNQLDELDL